MTKHNRTLWALGTALLLMRACPAFADSWLNLNVSADTGVESNPYLEPSPVKTELSGSLDLMPVFHYVTGQSKLTLTGDVRIKRYLRTYGTDTSEFVGADFSQRLSDQTSAHANAGFRSSISAFRDQLGVRADPSQIDVLPVLVLPDPSFIGQRIRTNVFQVGGGLQHNSSPVDSWTVDGSYTRSHSNNIAGADFNYINGQVGYSRRLSDRTTINASVGVGSSNYDNSSTGDGIIVTPQIGFSTTLSRTVTLSAQAGASYSQITQVGGAKQNTVAFSGNLRLCHRDEFNDYCLSAARATQPTSLGVVRSVTSASFDLRRKISRRDSLGVSASYSRSDGSQLAALGQNLAYIGGTANFSRQFDRRFQGNLSTGVDKALNSPLERRPNFYFRIAVRYVLGELR